MINKHAIDYHDLLIMLLFQPPYLDQVEHPELVDVLGGDVGIEDDILIVLTALLPLRHLLIGLIAEVFRAKHCIPVPFNGLN